MKALIAAGKSALIASAVLLVVAVGLLVYVLQNIQLGTAASAPHVASSVPRTPNDLTEEARQRLTAEGTRLVPVLEQVRASGDLTPDSVRRALVESGYRAHDVTSSRRAAPSDGSTYVVFAIEFWDGCVTGAVTPTEVDAQATGHIPAVGCLPPETT